MLWPLQKLLISGEKEKKSKYKLINAMLDMNKVTIQDVNFFFSVDKFSKDFADCMIVFLINFFSEYNQVSLAIQLQDFTAFITLFRLLHMTQLPIGAINLVAQFFKIITKIL